MSADEIKLTLLEMADSDPTLSEEAKLLIRGALESDDMFAEVLRGEAGPIVRPDQTNETSRDEPVGASFDPSPSAVSAASGRRCGFRCTQVPD